MPGLQISAPLPKWKTKVEFPNQKEDDNDDIRQVLEANYPAAVEQVKDFRKNFEGLTLEETCYNVWQYLRKHIDYKGDGDNQDIRLPARLIADGTGDCKSYALLAAAILSYYAQVGFRYSSFDPTDKTPSHVYCIVKHPYGGSPIIVDGVWTKFDSEKTPTSKIDEWMKVRTLSGINGMKVRTLSGTDPENIKELTQEQRDAMLTELYNDITSYFKMYNRYNNSPKHRAECKYCESRIKELSGYIGAIRGTITDADFQNANIVGVGPAGAILLANNQSLPPSTTNGAYYIFKSVADFNSKMPLPYGSSSGQFSWSFDTIPATAADLKNYKQLPDGSPQLAAALAYWGAKVFGDQLASSRKFTLQNVEGSIINTAKAAPAVLSIVTDTATGNIPAAVLAAKSLVSTNTTAAPQPAPVNIVATPSPGVVVTQPATTSDNTTPQPVIVTTLQPTSVVGGVPLWAKFATGIALLLGGYEIAKTEKLI